MPPRKRPGQEPDNGSKAAKAEYSIFAVNDDGILTPLGDHSGRTANDAVKTYLGDDPESGEHHFEVVPKRNRTTVKVKIASVKKTTFA
jgi:hypothetical protein